MISAAIIMAAVAATSISCEKDPSGGNSGNRDDSGEATPNPGLVGNWSIDRYEAINKAGNVYASVTDPAVIRKNYWMIGFSNDGKMTTHMGEEDNAITFPYNYYEASNSVRFNTFGRMDIVSLDESALIFDSEFFAPDESWYDNAVISYIRVYCSK